MLTPAYVLIYSLALCAPLPTLSVTSGDPTPIDAPSEYGCEPLAQDSALVAGMIERAELRAAQNQAPELAAMRAGLAPSNEQWGWIAIGAAIVLLIILL